ncbi:MAG: hypothetical protein J6M66_06425 [Lachnospiraceae bacterium]|nr:hypothetical protein [Lachnospiraceae bacterium]
MIKNKVFPGRFAQDGLRETVGKYMQHGIVIGDRKIADIPGGSGSISGFLRQITTL